MSPARSARVLLVEDDEAGRYAFARALEAAGFRVTAASGALEALALLDRGLAVDVLVSDIALGEREAHGIALARMVHAARPHVATVLMTAYPAYREHAGDFPVLAKPFDAARLVREIERVLAPA